MRATKSHRVAPPAAWHDRRHGGRGPLRALLATLAGALACAPAAHAVAPSTVRASLTATGAEILAYNALPSVSQDGRWVAFDSYSDAVVPGDANGVRDVFLRDMQTGAVRRVSALPDGTSANGPSGGSSMSADGRWIAFVSDATNLAPGPNTALDDVYLYDRVTGSLRRVSTSLTGKDGAGTSRAPRVASDGTHLVFESTANDLVAGDTRDKDAFIADVATLTLRRRASGPTAASPPGTPTRRTSATAAASSRSPAWRPDVVPGDANVKADVFVRDLPPARRPARASARAAGRATATPSGPTSPPTAARSPSPRWRPTSSPTSARA